MSGREWKPGDVVLIPKSESERMFITEEGGVLMDGRMVPPEVADRLMDVRPLVVLDPEDRVQIERLADVFCDYPSSGWVDEMQDALRTLASPKPLKPGEPMGLGAVVEDTEGSVWTRLAKHAASPWVTAETAGRTRVASWDALDVVIVHAEGWEDER